MAVNADMLDSDQNRVKVELFHAQFWNLANRRCFLVGVREVQGEDSVGVVPTSRLVPTSNFATLVAFKCVCRFCGPY